MSEKWPKIAHLNIFLILIGIWMFLPKKKMTKISIFYNCDNIFVTSFFSPIVFCKKIIVYTISEKHIRNSSIGLFWKKAQYYSQRFGVKVNYACREKSSMCSRISRLYSLIYDLWKLIGFTVFLDVNFQWWMRSNLVDQGSTGVSDMYYSTNLLLWQEIPFIIFCLNQFSGYSTC